MVRILIPRNRLATPIQHRALELAAIAQAEHAHKQLNLRVNALYRLAQWIDGTDDKAKMQRWARGMVKICEG